VDAHVDMRAATKVALSSMISTSRANLSVGPPYDLAWYRNGSLELEEGRIEADSPLLSEIQRLWTEHLLIGLADLPDVDPSDLGG
jgi:putative proteasome-type protease